MPAAYGAYGGAYGGMQQASPYLDAKVIETQKLDATNALGNQHKLQTDMLTHQYDAQKLQLKAEFERNVTMATQQFEAQMLQQTMQIDMQNKMANLYSTGLAGAAGAGAKPA